MKAKSPNNIAKSIQEANRNFKRYFKIDAIRFLDPLLATITNKFELNIINFDNWLHKQGYIENKHGSIKNYLLLEYGLEATKYIVSLLILKPRVIKRRKRTIEKRGVEHGKSK